MFFWQSHSHSQNSQSTCCHPAVNNKMSCNILKDSEEKFPVKITWTLACLGLNTIKAQCSHHFPDLTPHNLFLQNKMQKSYFDIVINNKFTPTIVHKRTTRYSVCFLKSRPHKLWFTVSAVIRFILYKNYGEALFWEHLIIQKSTWWSWDKKIEPY